MSSTLDLIDEAEEAFLMNNFSEAVNLATMAKQRYPSFDYIDKFLKAYSIHSDATNNKLGNGEIDWYAVLGAVDSKSETKDLKKQYQVGASRSSRQECFSGGRRSIQDRIDRVGSSFRDFDKESIR
ncbi:hypothetical protein LOK49_LG09G00339 [Camellia lanceoleosa]|uniref:Uncharacterized protein n=1 Tax=Camellia lanceoleosa TaxID=1840588 RepID=A0ACC0GJ28_9ERIC|nr:hypothetical protein LOK49_LG09G00339 [Camellia lanceoleosa]